MHTHFTLRWTLAGLATTAMALSPLVAVGLRAQGHAAPARIAAPSTAVAAADMFIKIDGIDGESTDSAHQKWIDVLSIDWGSNSAVRGRRPGANAGGGGTVTLVRRTDRASARLTDACSSGRSLGRVVLHEPAGRGTYTEYTLDDVRISSCSSGTSGGRPTENVTLNFGKVESSSVPGGNPDRPVVTGR